MNVINRAALCVYDGTPESPYFPELVGAPGEAASAYLSQVADKLMTSDGSRITAVEPGSAQEAMLRAFVLQPFADAAIALLRNIDDSLQTLEIQREGYDMAVFSFDLDGDPHIAVAQLVCRSVIMHRLTREEEGLRIELHASGSAMPPATGKSCAGFVINLSNGEVRLKDTAVLTNVGERQLFSQVLFSMPATRTEKEAVRAVEEIIRQAAPDIPEQELKPAVKRAMSRSIEEKGAIDVENVAQEVFRSDEEREALVEQVSRQVREEQIEPVIPVENKRVLAQMQKVKIRTDNGISITLPRELADDENSFAVVQNDDGTISIIINRVSGIKTE